MKDNNNNKYTNHNFNTNTSSYSDVFRWLFFDVHVYQILCVHSKTSSKCLQRNEPNIWLAVSSVPYYSVDIGFTVAFSGILGFFVFHTDFWYDVIRIINIFWRTILIQLPSLNIVVWNSIAKKRNNYSHFFPFIFCHFLWNSRGDTK